MFTQKEAIAIYKPIDPDNVIDFIKNNWWWISIVGEKIFRWVISLINKKKK